MLNLKQYLQVEKGLKNNDISNHLIMGILP